MEALLFMLTVTLHNAEEALFFDARRNDRKHFIFAALGITILAYLAAGLHLLMPENRLLESAFIGFVGAMLINAFAPHLLLTLKNRSYCPGVFTACFLIIPFHFIILSNAAKNGMAVGEIAASTGLVGGVLIGGIFGLKGVARLLFREG